MPQLLKIPSGNGDLVATASLLLFQIPAQATYSLIVSGPFGTCSFWLLPPQRTCQVTVI